MRWLRVLLADYHLLLLHALKGLLDPEYHVVGMVAGGERLIDSAIRLKPDIIIADLAMPRMDGLESLERIKKLLPHVRVVMLTANEDPEVAIHALSCGVSGYLLKSASATELFAALRCVSMGRRYVAPIFAEALADSTSDGRRPERFRRNLTPRQCEVLRLIAQGHTMRQVAAELDMSPRTVAFHKYRMMNQWHLKSTVELVRLAIREGLVSNPSTSLSPVASSH